MPGDGVVVSLLDRDGFIPDDLVPIKRAAWEAGLSRSTVEKYAAQGWIRAWQPGAGSGRLVSLAEVCQAQSDAWDRMVATRNSKTASQPRDANNQNFVRAGRSGGLEKERQ